MTLVPNTPIFCIGLYGSNQRRHYLHTSSAAVLEQKPLVTVRKPGQTQLFSTCLLLSNSSTSQVLVGSPDYTMVGHTAE